MIGHCGPPKGEFAACTRPQTTQLCTTDRIMQTLTEIYDTIKTMTSQVSSKNLRALGMPNL